MKSRFGDTEKKRRGGDGMKKTTHGQGWGKRTKKSSEQGDKGKDGRGGEDIGRGVRE